MKAERTAASSSIRRRTVFPGFGPFFAVPCAWIPAVNQSDGPLAVAGERNR